MLITLYAHVGLRLSAVGMPKVGVGGTGNENGSWWSNYYSQLLLPLIASVQVWWRNGWAAAGTDMSVGSGEEQRWWKVGVPLGQSQAPPKGLALGNSADPWFWKDTLSAINYLKIKNSRVYHKEHLTGIQENWVQNLTLIPNRELPQLS